MPRNKITRFFAAVATATVLGGASTSLPAAEYSIDPAHSFIEFRIKHLGYAWLYGRFNTVSGSFSHDSASPSGNMISVDIDPASVDTNHAERDKHLRSADFLEVEKYAAAGFKSTGYVGNADSGIMTGDLTLKGVTKSIDIEVQKLGEGDDPWGGYRAGFTGTVTIDRRDFGVDYDLGPVANMMVIQLGIEGTKN